MHALPDAFLQARWDHTVGVHPIHQLRSHVLEVGRELGQMLLYPVLDTIYQGVFSTHGKTAAEDSPGHLAPELGRFQAAEKALPHALEQPRMGQLISVVEEEAGQLGHQRVSLLLHNGALVKAHHQRSAHKGTCEMRWLAKCTESLFTRKKE